MATSVIPCLQAVTTLLLLLLTIPNGPALPSQIPTTPFALFAIVMTAWITITFFLIRSLVTTQGKALNGIVARQERIANTLDTFGGTMGRALVLMEDRTGRNDRRWEEFMPLFYALKGDVGTVMHAMVNSAIIPVPAGRKMEAHITREGDNKHQPIESTLPEQQP